VSLRIKYQRLMVKNFTILNGLDNVPDELKNCVLTIGNFDGCHLGHQRIFLSALSIANSQTAGVSGSGAKRPTATEKTAGVSGSGAKRPTATEKIKTPVLALTFEPHPRDVFAKEPFMFRLTVGEQKARALKAFGFDGIIIMPFDKDLASLEAREFVQKYFLDALDIKAIVVGEDFHFGKNRSGTPEFLAHCGSECGFEVHQLNLLENGHASVSSSRIREALSEGQLDVANSLLGYHWIVEGEVITGDKRGRELGYPTANFVLADNSNLAQGVYAARVKLGERLFDGIASFGKPMFENSQPPFEVHIFDFDEDIYGQHIEVALIKHIRGQMVFDGLDELIVQMDKDSAKAKIALANVKPLSKLDEQLGFII